MRWISEPFTRAATGEESGMGGRETRQVYLDRICAGFCATQSAFLPSSPRLPAHFARNFTPANHTLSWSTLASLVVEIVYSMIEMDPRQHWCALSSGLSAFFHLYCHFFITQSALVLFPVFFTEPVLGNFFLPLKTPATASILPI